MARNSMASPAYEGARKFTVSVDVHTMGRRVCRAAAMEAVHSIHCMTQPPNVVPMCWQWWGMTSSVETVVPSAIAGLASWSFFFGIFWRSAFRPFASSARSLCSSTVNTSAGRDFLSLQTNVDMAWQHTSGSEARSPSRSMVTVTPTSMEVVQAWCTRAISFTTSPTRTGLRKWMSSMEAVTQCVPLKRSADMQAQMSIHLSRGPASSVPCWLESEGRTSCVIVTTVSSAGHRCPAGSAAGTALAAGAGDALASGAGAALASGDALTSSAGAAFASGAASASTAIWMRSAERPGISPQPACGGARQNISSMAFSLLSPFLSNM
mmetsp:Transcript_102091/g.284229  ORF Transcript_102091/g.284229 Transcript_102091/m.284229 type:complete len:323 (-) Transcript_102091:110-1078(-)